MDEVEYIHPQIGEVKYFSARSNIFTFKIGGVLKVNFKENECIWPREFLRVNVFDIVDWKWMYLTSPIARVNVFDLVDFRKWMYLTSPLSRVHVFYHVD